MTEAIFGLVGVLVGGILTGAVAYLLERQRERRATRAAARLLLEPLMSADLAVQYIRRGEKWEVRGAPPSDELWHEHKSLMASALSGEEWVAVADAFRTIRLLPQLRIEIRDEKGPPLEEIAEVTLALDFIPKGIEVLERLARVPPGTSVTRTVTKERT